MAPFLLTICWGMYGRFVRNARSVGRFLDFAAMSRRRLFWIFVMVFSGWGLCLWSYNAQAQVVGEYYFTVSTPPPFTYFPSATEACREKLVRLQAGGTWAGRTFKNASGPFGANGYFDCWATNSTGATENFSTVPRYKCPNSTPYFDYTQKVCVAAQPPPPVICKAGEEGSGHWYRGPVAGPTPDFPFKGASDGVCEIDMFDVVQCYKATDGNAYCEYRYRKTGEPKAAGPANSPTAGPKLPNPTQAPNGRTDVPPQASNSGACPTGTVQGGVSSDGVPVCMGSGSAPKNPTPPPPKVEATKTEATPDGGSKTTNTTITSNSDGSKTTTTTVVTTAPDGSKTTTVAKDTTAAVTGGAGRDESSKDDEKFDLCKQNPMLTICRNSTVSGTCGETTCNGDAIQCATLRAAAAMECRDKKNQEDLAASPLVASGNNIIGGTDTTAADFVKGSTVDMSKQNLDQSGFVAGGACLANRSFTVAGRSVEVSFVRVCDSIQPLRAVVMACAFIISYLIVSRSVIQA